jgi:hypothetical protein
MMRVEFLLAALAMSFTLAQPVHAETVPLLAQILCNSKLLWRRRSVPRPHH